MSPEKREQAYARIRSYTQIAYAKEIRADLLQTGTPLLAIHVLALVHEKLSCINKDTLIETKLEHFLRIWPEHNLSPKWFAHQCQF